jgi:hypothetical protein
VINITLQAAINTGSSDMRMILAISEYFRIEKNKNIYTVVILLF